MVSHEFYLNVYGGSSIPAEEWDLFRKRAEEKIGQYKRKYRVFYEREQSPALAVCAVADALAYFAAAQNGAGVAVTSASIGSVSVSYGSGAVVDLSPKGQEKELLRCARTYLDIYRGVG